MKILVNFNGIGFNQAFRSLIITFGSDPLDLLEKPAKKRTQPLVIIYPEISPAVAGKFLNNIFIPAFSIS